MAIAGGKHETKFEIPRLLTVGDTVETSCTRQRKLLSVTAPGKDHE